MTIKIEINLKILRIQFHDYTGLSQVLISHMKLVIRLMRLVILWDPAGRVKSESVCAA